MSNWSWIQSNGAQSSYVYNSSLTTYIPSVKKNDLIVVSGAFYYYFGQTISVYDNVNNVNYNYIGPALIPNAQNLGTWWYRAPKNGNYTITLNTSGFYAMSLVMVVDEFNYPGSISYVADSIGSNATSSYSTISLISNLTVTGIDMIYNAASTSGAGHFSQGYGFNLGFSAPFYSIQAYNIASGYLLNNTTAINPLMSNQNSVLTLFNAISFKAIVPSNHPLLLIG